MRPQACAAPDIVTTGMRNTMNNLLQTYVKNENFDNIISDFYDEVKLSDLVKHYFLAAKKPGLIRDLKKYHVYLLPKSELEFNQRPTSSSLFDIQLPGNQFQEVTEILVKVLRKYKVSSIHSPRLLHEILTIVEETRSQCNETEVSTLDRVEIDPEKIYKLLNRNRISSDVMPSKAVRTERGLPHPVWIHTDFDSRMLLIKSKIVIKDSAMQDQIEEVIEKTQISPKFLEIKLDNESGPQALVDSHEIPFLDGIPIRLFIAYLRRFSSDFSRIYSFDKENILKLPTN
jgi:hypothetical protein